MKKLLAIVAVSSLMLTACGGGSTTPVKTDDAAKSTTTPAATSTTSDADKNANLVNFLVDAACATAKYDGNVPDAEGQAINKKYGFADDKAVKAALKDAVPQKADIEDKAAAKIETTCKADFDKGGVDAKSFLDLLFE